VRRLVARRRPKERLWSYALGWPSSGQGARCPEFNTDVRSHRERVVYEFDTAFQSDAAQATASKSGTLVSDQSKAGPQGGFSSIFCTLRTRMARQISAISRGFAHLRAHSRDTKD